MNAQAEIRRLVSLKSKTIHALRSEDIERADAINVLKGIFEELVELLSMTRSVIIEVDDDEEEDIELDVLYWEDNYIVLMDDTIVTPKKILRGGIRLNIW